MSAQPTFDHRDKRIRASDTVCTGANDRINEPTVASVGPQSNPAGCSSLDGGDKPNVENSSQRLPSGASHDEDIARAISVGETGSETREKRKGDSSDGKSRLQQSQQKKKDVVPPTPVTHDQPLPEGLSVWDNAVLLIDKPKGWTSFDVCGKLRGALAALLRRKPRQIKVGHAGTLDPMATGLLIVCVGKGTKSIDTFVSMRKEYSGTMRLGEATNSYDADGTISETLPWEDLTDSALEAARDKFLGEIDQIPPMFSALRVGGKRLYEAARQGKEIERTSRKVIIDSFEISRNPEDRQCVDFKVVCSKGTYVRSLAHDLGKAVGSAAHLIALRREAIGDLRVENAWNLEGLVAAITEHRNRLKNERGGGRHQQQGQQQQTEETVSPQGIDGIMVQDDETAT